MPPPTLPDHVRTRLERAGIHAGSANFAALAIYLGLLTKWNETVNLTALKLNPASDQAVDRLLIEPLLAAGAIELVLAPPRPSQLRLLDVGSGGGSPAIPLAIGLGSNRPVALRMVESKVRKAAFLRDAIRQIPLRDAEVFNERLEDLTGRPELQGAFDIASMRAIRADGSLWESLSRLIRAGGRVLWFRSANEPRIDAQSFKIESAQPLTEGNELVVLRGASTS